MPTWELQRLREKADKLTGLLGGLCEKLVEAERQDLINGDLQAWWKEHQREREEKKHKRKVCEQEEAERQAIVATLSPEQRRILGVRD